MFAFGNTECILYFIKLFSEGKHPRIFYAFIVIESIPLPKKENTILRKAFYVEMKKKYFILLFQQKMIIFADYNIRMKLKATHITKSFGNNKVLSDVSMELSESKISVLMGTNGSGKTTLLNILSGFLKPDSGQTSLNGKLISGIEPDKLHRMGIGRTFQDMRLIKDLSVLENVMLAFPSQEGEKWWKSFLPNKRIREEQKDNRQTANEILKACFIEDVSKSKAGEISYGQQKLLNLACCIAGGTSIWLLDEPVAGVNSSYRENLSGIIKQQKEKGCSILIIEHNSDFISEVADEILFLNEGIIRSFSSYEEFKNDNLVKNSYI